MKAGYDYIGVGVGAVVFNIEGEVLLSRRGPQATNERGCWEFPGGKVGFGERRGEAIQRELRKEHGIEIEVLALLGVNDHILVHKGQHWVTSTFIARHVSGEPRILEPQKCSDIGWFSLAALPEPLSEASQVDVLNLSRKSECLSDRVKRNWADI